MIYIGYDIGSSSVKAALIDGKDGTEICRVQSPAGEMPIDAPKPGWGEQHPDMWWEHTLKATQLLLEKAEMSPKAIRGIGISYQMHGLVTLDKAFQKMGLDRHQIDGHHDWKRRYRPSLFLQPFLHLQDEQVIYMV